MLGSQNGTPIVQDILQSPKSARAEPAISTGIDLVGVVKVGEDDGDLLHDGEHCIGRVTGSCTIGNHILRHRSQRSMTMTME
eukprot:XP_001706044.1 Hypothetical protein GL50803_101683 [Giardia lamblia ATCC 50803]